MLKSKTLSRLNESLNVDLSHFDTWLISNKLSFNVAKTHSMLVSTKAKRNAIDRSNQNQIRAVSSKVFSGLGVLRHAKNFFTFFSLTSLYTSMVEPHFR